MTCTRPSPIDCLANAFPVVPNMSSSEQDINRWQNGTVVFDRQDLNALDGGIPVLGDSNVAQMDVSQISPFAINRGIGGDTDRGIINRLTYLSSQASWRGSINTANNIIHRAGAVVYHPPVNGVCWAYAEYAIADFTAWLDSLAAAMTGKWVMNHMFHVGAGVVGPNGRSDNNTRIAQMNGYIDQIFANRTDVAIVNVNPIIAPNGYLLPEHTVDNVHLLGNAVRIAMAADNAALVSMGVAS